MNYNIKVSKPSKNLPLSMIFVLGKDKEIIGLETFNFSSKEIQYITKQVKKKIYLFQLPSLDKQIFIQIISKPEKEEYKKCESYRIAGSKLQKEISKNKIKTIALKTPLKGNYLLPYAEGILLADYKFLKYKTEKINSELKELILDSTDIKKEEVDYLSAIVEGTFIARDLVNEPGSFLTAVELSKQIAELGKKFDFYTEVFNKSKIESLKMGGILAVNSGSTDPPTFNIMEWKPKKVINSRPIVFVGKGIVFDTGGLSLKSTTNSMDEMKSDMAGAAAVIGAMYVIANLKLPVHVIGLIPATDNRPGLKAYLPGDVIKMYDGSTVEVMNTDAEGRMVLADALAYAKKYKPELVFDLATLTGSAAVALGKYGMVCVSNDCDKDEKLLINSSYNTYERIVKFPNWDEYDELIKSEIADVKNIGGRIGGAITAAKFLQRFTDYPWIHLDIAGPAFISQEYNYLTKGGTGVGVRLLSNFIKSKIENK